MSWGVAMRHFAAAAVIWSMATMVSLAAMVIVGFVAVAGRWACGGGWWWWWMAEKGRDQRSQKISLGCGISIIFGGKLMTRLQYLTRGIYLAGDVIPRGIDAAGD